MSERPLATPGAVETAVVLTHTVPEQTSAALASAVRAAREAGSRLYAPASVLETHPTLEQAPLPLSELEGDPDLCIVLGGDGTLLKGLRIYGAARVPVFGVNFGTVGFLATVERDQLADGLARAFAAEFEVIAVPGLETTLDAGTPLALNDVSLIRRQHGRVAELSYSLEGREVGHVRCDGLVVATPTGSTGYNLANSGPILAWGVEGYVVSFIAPHTLTARPLVVAPNDVLKLRNAAGRDPVEIVLDGELDGELASGAEIEVRFRRDAGRLAQLPGSTFYGRMREKFGRLAH